ncbi:MAG TPA: sigma-70 family RNA polymerase sigma factor [Anaerolineales bacterium]|nr:sigma-70 family RNA polymerase sigma factor [Anaerolineales bacterium]
MAQSIESGLVSKAANGDLDAFNQLVLTYQDILYNHALNLLGDPDWAEDVTQESFLKAFQKLNDFRGGSFRAWVLKITTNTSYDLYRRKNRHPTRPLHPVTDDGEEIESPAWLADPAVSVEKTVQQNEENKDLYRMLDELPAAYRSVIALVDVYEMDYAEAAEVLHVPIGTLKSRLARARMQMQEKLRGAQHNSVTSRMETKADVCFGMR